MSRLSKALFLTAGIALASACSGQAADAGASVNEQNASSIPVVEEKMKIRIIAAGKEFRAVLEDNAAAHDFAALLPIEVQLTDYNRTEKIADLPKRLSTDGTPDGIDPAVGDLTYYAPWGNLAIFYRDFGYSRGLVRLGRIESGIEELAKVQAGTVRIERLGADGQP